MDWTAIGVSFLSTLFIYAMFSNDGDEEELETENGMGDGDDHTELEIHEVKGRLTTLYCESCRKQKKHREIKMNLWQCTRCKRHIDLRAS